MRAVRVHVRVRVRVRVQVHVQVPVHVRVPVHVPVPVHVTGANAALNKPGLSGQPWSTPLDAFTSHARPLASQYVCIEPLPYHAAAMLPIGVPAKLFTTSLLPTQFKAFLASNAKTTQLLRHSATVTKLLCIFSAAALREMPYCCGPPASLKSSLKALHAALATNLRTTLPQAKGRIFPLGLRAASKRPPMNAVMTSSGASPKSNLSKTTPAASSPSARCFNVPQCSNLDPGGPGPAKRGKRQIVIMRLST